MKIFLKMNQVQKLILCRSNFDFICALGTFGHCGWDMIDDCVILLNSCSLSRKLVAHGKVSSMTRIQKDNKLGSILGSSVCQSSRLSLYDFLFFRSTIRVNWTSHLGKEFYCTHVSCARAPNFINLREVCSRFRLPAGNYVIVPSTFDVDEEGEFMLLVFSEKKANMSYGSSMK